MARGTRREDRNSTKRREILRSMGLIGTTTLASGPGLAMETDGKGRASCTLEGDFDPRNPNDVEAVWTCLESSNEPKERFESLPPNVKEGLKKALTVADVETKKTDSFVESVDGVSVQDHGEYVKTVSATSWTTNIWGSILCEFTHYCRFRYDGSDVFDITHWTGDLGAYHGWSYDGTVRDTVEIYSGSVSASKTEAFSLCMDFCVDNTVIGNQIIMHSNGDWGVRSLS